MFYERGSATFVITPAAPLPPTAPPPVIHPLLSSLECRSTPLSQYTAGCLVLTLDYSSRWSNRDLHNRRDGATLYLQQRDISQYRATYTSTDNLQCLSFWLPTINTRFIKKQIYILVLNKLDLSSLQLRFCHVLTSCS